MKNLVQRGYVHFLFDSLFSAGAIFVLYFPELHSLGWPSMKTFFQKKKLYLEGKAGSFTRWSFILILLGCGLSGVRISGKVRAWVH